MKNRFQPMFKKLVKAICTLAFLSIISASPVYNQSYTITQTLSDQAQGTTLAYNTP